MFGYDRSPVEQVTLNGRHCDRGERRLSNTLALPSNRFAAHVHTPVKIKLVLPALISEPPIKTVLFWLTPSTYVPLSELKSFNR